MQLPSFSVQLVQSNATVAALTREVLGEAGVSLVGGELVGGELVGGEEGQGQADLLLFDVSSWHDQPSRALLQAHQAAGKPVLFCGLKPHRNRVKEHEQLWLERPFSSGALLFHCAHAMNLEWDPFPEEPRASAEFSAHEHVLQEAALLEEEFGLEPGVLGGLSERSERGVEVLELESLDGVFGEPGLPADDSSLLEQGVVMGGTMVGEGICAVHVDPSEILSTSGLGPSGRSAPELGQGSSPPRTSSAPTHRALPALARQQEAGGEGALRLALDPQAQGRIMSDESYEELPRLDQEASLELRGFARLLSQAWNAVGNAAREEDRYDRINRIIHALFEHGLDAAAAEIKRLPAQEGFFGSIRTFSMVGLFRTIRERQLRGRLEISLPSGEAYALTLDHQWLVQIESLQGDDEALLLEALIALEAIPWGQVEALATGLDQDSLDAPPLRARLRELGVGKEALDAAGREVSKRLFKKTCQARQGHFSFSEIRPGTGVSWPSSSLHLSVEELLIQVLRESSIDTGVSEATSRTRLMPDAAQLLRLKAEVLTPEERELLAFFESGATLGRARAHFDHLGGQEGVDRVVNRLKRAQLLQRVQTSRTESGMAVTRSSLRGFELEEDSTPDAHGSQTRVASEPPMPPVGLEPLAQSEDQTMVTDVSDSMIQEGFKVPSQLGALDPYATAKGPGPFVLHEEVIPEAFEQPTRNVAGHEVLPPWSLQALTQEEGAVGEDVPPPPAPPAPPLPPDPEDDSR